MFEEKTYMWFLGELFKLKFKLKILDIAFCKADHIELVYFTDHDGTVSASPNKSLLIRDVLKKFLSNRTNGLETRDFTKPILYASYCLSKKIYYSNELQEIIRKDIKQPNLKELIICQECSHDYSIFYTLELEFDGEGLVSSLLRKDIKNPEIIKNDFKYMHLTVNLSKHLVKVIENLLDKNIIRLKYDFVVDMQFNPVILNITQIKTVHPKVLALNQGLNAGQLESLTLLKNEYKNSQFNRLQTHVKEPEIDNSTPTLDNGKTSTCNIFSSFILKFLSGDSKKLVKSKTIKQEVSQQITPVTLSFAEKTGEYSQIMNIEKFPFGNKFTLSPQPLLTIETSTLSIENLMKRNTTNRLPQVSSSRCSTKKIMFPNLKPSISLSNFLKIEEERIKERQMKKAKLLETETDQLPAIIKQTKRKITKKKRNKKNSKKTKVLKYDSKELLELFSPYSNLNTVRTHLLEITK